jgi:hypothetical protein
MSADDLDDMMRKLVPPVAVAPDRAARVMDRVMARLDEQPIPAREGMSRWLASLLPMSRFALPMAAAALLGVVVGKDLRPDSHLVTLDQVFVATFYAGLGY